jgi:hypothetical protein
MSEPTRACASARGRRRGQPAGPGREELLGCLVVHVDRSAGVGHRIALPDQAQETHNRAATSADWRSSR